MKIQDGKVQHLLEDSNRYGNLEDFEFSQSRQQPSEVQPPKRDASEKHAPIRITMTEAGNHFMRTSFVSMFKSVNEMPHPQRDAASVADRVSAVKNSRQELFLANAPHFKPESDAIREEFEDSDKLLVTDYVAKVSLGMEALDNEIKVLQVAIEENNAGLFNRLKFSNEEVLDLRFKLQMNILQAACYYSAESVVRQTPLIIYNIMYIMIYYLVDKFKGDEHGMQELVDFKEPFAGNTAIHFAVLKGNPRILDSLIKDFKASLKTFTITLHYKNVLTINGLTILHCAAQSDRGTLSLQMFCGDPALGISVDQRDNYDCTALHFALKCVECLIAKGADVNAINSDQQSSLHIAVLRFIQQTQEDADQGIEADPSEFEEFKRVLKELLFNGADRSIKGRFILSSVNRRLSSEVQMLTALELLKHFEDLIPKSQFSILHSFLQGAKQNICIQTRRPLEKVRKNRGFMLSILSLYLICILISFISLIQSMKLATCMNGICFYGQTLVTNQAIQTIKILDIVAIILAIFGLTTYLMTNMMKPGFVESSLDLVELLKHSNDRNIDLENFCFYCKVIKSTRTFHCMICQRCVEKFDHHCVYINNCLGYRNHKYFMMFLFFMVSYLIISTMARIMNQTMFGSSLDTAETQGWWYFQILALIYTATLNFLTAFPILIQIREQCKRIRHIEFIERPATRSIYQNTNSSLLRGTTPGGRKSTSVYEGRHITEARGGCCQNLKDIFAYRPVTQEILQKFLLSDSERLSTFIGREERKLKQAEIGSRSVTSKSDFPSKSNTIATKQSGVGLHLDVKSAPNSQPVYTSSAIVPFAHGGISSNNTMTEVVKGTGVGNALGATGVEQLGDGGSNNSRAKVMYQSIQSSESNTESIVQRALGTESREQQQ